MRVEDFQQALFTFSHTKFVDNFKSQNSSRYLNKLNLIYTFMGRYARRKGKAASCKGIGRRGGKTKTKTRDLDQIKYDIANNEQFVKALDASGEEKISHLYCIECSRLFQSEDILAKHLKSKTHKQRVKKLEDWPSDHE